MHNETNGTNESSDFVTPANGTDTMQELSGGAIAGTTLGVLALAILSIIIVLATVLYLRRSREKR